jgi:hypothetical protein
VFGSGGGGGECVVVSHDTNTFTSKVNGPDAKRIAIGPVPFTVGLGGAQGHKGALSDRRLPDLEFVVAHVDDVGDSEQKCREMVGRGCNNDVRWPYTLSRLSRVRHLVVTYTHTTREVVIIYKNVQLLWIASVCACAALLS